jgi:hypothetical protein
MLVLFGAAAATSFSEMTQGSARLVDVVRLVGFLALALLLSIRATTSFSLLGRNPVLDDELTRANRASAARAGYWAMIIGNAAALVGSMLTPISLVAVAPLLIAMGAAAAALRFAVLERRGNG